MPMPMPEIISQGRFMATVGYKSQVPGWLQDAQARLSDHSQDMCQIVQDLGLVTPNSPGQQHVCDDWFDDADGWWGWLRPANGTFRHGFRDIGSRR